MYAPQANAGSGLEELRETENRNRSISAGFPAKAAMIKTLLLNSFFSIPDRDIGKNFLAFFRFTEADACTLLFAYGLHALEENRLQNNRSNEPYQSPNNSPNGSQPGTTGGGEGPRKNLPRRVRCRQSRASIYQS
jgi:hypothetical protein